MPRGRKRSRARTWNDWIDANVKYVYLSLAVVAALCLVTVAVNSVRPSMVVAAIQDQPLPIPPGTGAAQPTQIAVIGDSYTYDTPEGWPRRALAAIPDLEEAGLSVSYDPGSGYVNRATGGSVFGEGVSEVVTANTDILIVMGSRNDVRAVDQVQASATALYASARAIASEVRVVVVGPVWVDANPPANVQQIRDALAAAASSAGIDFIDPLALGWFAEGTPGMFGDDLIHPTDEGQAYIAGRLAPLLMPILDAGGP